MRKVKLYCGDMALVAEVDVPVFNPAPDVLMWGQRVFKRVDDLAYFEAFTFWVPIMAKGEAPPVANMLPGELSKFDPGDGTHG